MIVKKVIYVIALLITSLGNAQGGEFEINGKIGNLSSPVKAILVCSSENIKEVTDINNGKFKFSGTLSKPVKAALFIDRKGNGHVSQAQRFFLYLEPGEMKISSEDNSVTNLKVEGSDFHDGFEEIQKALKPLNTQDEILESKYESLERTNQKDSAVLMDYKRQEFEIDSLKMMVYADFIRTHPDNIMSLESFDKINKYIGSTPIYDVARPLYDGLSDRLKKMEKAKSILAYLKSRKATEVGQVAPDFVQPDTKGNQVRLSDYRGNFVLVDFWASWCAPCREENPNLLKAYNKFHSKGLEIIGVSLDVEVMRKNWLAAVEKDNLPWIQLSDLKGPQSEPAVLYGIQTIPQNVLISPEGIIIKKNLRGKELHSELENIFRQER